MRAETIYYDVENKEVVIIFGYLQTITPKYITEIAKDVHKAFPKIPFEKVSELPFNEVADRSRRHRNMHYTRFAYVIDDIKKDASGYLTYLNRKIFVISSHKKDVDGWMWEDESANSVMNRMIHD
jgi:hypothetical protein